MSKCKSKMIVKKGHGLVLILLLLTFLLPPLVLAVDDFKPYLHKPSVPDYPKIKLFGQYQTYLFPGAATYTFPFEVPKGTNDLQPFIALTYNSQTMRQRPGIVGAGWIITQNVVYRNINFTTGNVSDDEFRLLFNGNEYELIYNSVNQLWHTEVESYFRIQNVSGSSLEINDLTPVGMINVLIFNNSYGKIQWHHNGSGSFLENISVGSGTKQFGLDTVVFIGSNIIAVNTTDILTTTGNKINSSVNITLQGLSFGIVTTIFKTLNFTASSSAVLSTGTDCVGITCTLQSYNGGTLTFNTSYLGSYAGGGSSNLIDVYNTSKVYSNSTAYAAIRFFVQNNNVIAQLLNWSFNSSGTTLNSVQSTNLTSAENVIVFVEKNYPALGQYSVAVNGTNGAVTDTEQVVISMG